MNAIVTICNGEYSKLFDLWYKALRKMTGIPIFVLCLNGYLPKNRHNLEIVSVDPNGNPFQPDSPDHACAEKLRIFQHLPNQIKSILFLDVDVLVLQNFWEKSDYFDTTNGSLVICQDFFVGYKEKMEAEFKPFDPYYCMKFYNNGSYCYFNTGVFFASRNQHKEFFLKSLEMWKQYIASQNRLPSIFDQNIINYCINKFNIKISVMPIQNNCLRQYNTVLYNRNLILNNQPVNVYHFNGGDGTIKYSRWLKMLSDLRGSK